MVKGYACTERCLQSFAILGFLLISVSVFAAGWTVPTSYELSIYGSTPILFWMSLMICFIIGIYLNTFNRYNVRGDKLLLFLSFTVVMLLPVLRGYYFIGEGDALTHLGIARSLTTTTIGVTDIFYPSIHLLSIFMSNVSNFDLRYGMMLLSLLFLLLFVTSSYIIARAFISFKYRYFGIFVAGLLLPVNLISVHSHPHPVSSAILYSPYFIFSYIMYRKSESNPWFLIHVVLFASILLLHPQIGATILLFMLMLLLFNIYESGRNNQHINSNIYVLTTTYLVIFWVWSSTQVKFLAGVQGHITSLLLETPTASQVQQRSVSVSELGLSFELLGVRLFFVGFVAALLSFAIVVICFNRYRRSDFRNLLNIDSRKSINRFIVILALGTFPAVGLFLFTLVVDITTQYFRYQGFIMGVVTIISIYSVKPIHSIVRRRRSRRLVYVSVLTLLLALSIMVYFPSPYILQPNSQVPESQLAGYETGLEISNPNYDIMYLRSPPNRYFDARLAPTGKSKETFYRGSKKAPDHFASQNVHTNSEPQYIAVTRRDYAQEINLYEEFRFNTNDFRYLENTPRINKVHTSHETVFYFND